LPVVTLAPASACGATAPFALTGGFPAGGTYNGPGVSNGIFDPAAAGPGSHSISYSYTDANGCSATATATITVGTLPAPTVTVSQGISCQSNTIYIGYGPQFLTLTATTTGVVTYQWYQDGVLIPGATASTLQVTSAAVYSVVASDASGCSSSPSSPTAIAAINTVDVRCGHNMDKVVLCHVPPGNSGNPQTLCISPNAVPAHLSNHPGDCLGPCVLRLSAKKAVITESDFSVYPNPFTKTVNVDFEVFETSTVFVGLYDMEGRLVQTLFNGTAEDSKPYQVICNGTDLTSGVYFVKLIAGDYARYEKLIKF